jgi:Flp pilus assembly protein TadG
MCFPHSLRKALSRQEGASIVEFALSVGIYLALTFGVLVVCWALFTYEDVDYAARQAVRWASVRGSQCAYSSNMPDCNASATDIRDFVLKLNYPMINSANLTVSAQWMAVTYTANPTAGLPPIASWSPCSGQCNTPGNEVQVTVSYNANLGIPLFSSFAPVVSSTSAMVISQ